jgi:hypothetical protein
MPLFLYNFETKELHGIFKAASDGDWEIDPYGEACMKVDCTGPFCTCQSLAPVLPKP